MARSLCGYGNSQYESSRLSFLCSIVGTKFKVKKSHNENFGKDVEILDSHEMFLLIEKTEISRFFHCVTEEQTTLQDPLCEL